MSSWGYVGLGYALTFAALALFVWRTERRIASMRRRLRSGGQR